MTGELAFIIAEKAEATVLPSTALQEGAMYVVRNSHLVKVEPKVGLRSFDRIELIEGLEADDRVVVSPVGTLQTGQHVRITEIDPREAAGLSKDKKAEGAAMKGIK
jgi:hypothetical protein